MMASRRTPSMQDALEALIRHGVEMSAVIDVGVHSGTPPLMRALPKVKHHLIEPVEFHFSTIQKNYAAFDYEIHPVALSNEDGETYLIGVSVDGGNRVSHSRISSTPVKPEDEPGVLVCKKIQRVRLDTLLTSVSVEAPFVLKIDVDGHEIQILEGAEHSLRVASTIVIEAVLHKRQSPGFLTRLQFLHDHGFILIDIVELAYYDGILWQVDLVFVRDDIVDRLESLKAFGGRGFQFDRSRWER